MIPGRMGERSRAYRSGGHWRGAEGAAQRRRCAATETRGMQFEEGLARRQRRAAPLTVEGRVRFGFGFGLSFSGFDSNLFPRGNSFESKPVRT